MRLALAQACASAALSAAGTTAAGLNTLAGVAAQGVRPADGAALAAGALTAGVVAGLWIPREIIRRRLAGMPRDRSSGPLVADSDFAASLSGSVVLVLALVWSGLLAWNAGAEQLRAFAGQHFLLPVPLKFAMLLAPPLVGLFLAGLLGTVTLVSLHGWYRALTFPRMPIAGLWVTLLFGAAAGSAGVVVLDPQWSAWGAVLALLLAAWVTGLRPRGSPPARPVTPVVGPLPWRALSAALLLVAAAAVLLGVMQRLAIQQTVPTPGGLGAAALPTACGALAGPALARVGRLRNHPALVGIAALLLAAWTSLLLPAGPPVRLALGCGLISLTIVVSAHDAAQRLASVQQALTICGLTVAAGFLAGLTATGLFVAPPRPAAPFDVRGVLPAAVRRAVALLGPDRVRIVTDAATLASLDLRADPPRLLILGDGSMARPNAYRLERLLRRFVRTLGPDGRVILVHGDAASPDGLRRRALWPKSWRAWRVDGESGRPVVLIGPDIPAWLAHARGAHDAPLHLEPQ